MLDSGLDHFAVAYLDDILVFSQNLEDHAENVRRVLGALETNSLYAKLEKCEFGKDEVEFLGHIVGKGGRIRTDPSKTRAIADMARPKSLYEVRKFYGMCSYYRNFIKAFADIAEPLVELLR